MRNCLDQAGLWTCMSVVNCLASDWYRKAGSRLGGGGDSTIPRQVILAFIRKLANHDSENKTESQLVRVSALSSCPDFRRRWMKWFVSVNQSNPFLSQLAFGQRCITAMATDRESFIPSSRMNSSLGSVKPSESTQNQVGGANWNSAEEEGPCRWIWWESGHQKISDSNCLHCSQPS